MHSCGSIDRRHNRRLQLEEALQNAASLPVDFVPFGRLVDRAQRISVDRVDERLTGARDDEDLVLAVVAYFGEGLWQLVVHRTSERDGPFVGVETQRKHSAGRALHVQVLIPVEIVRTSDRRGCFGWSGHSDALLNAEIS